MGGIISAIFGTMEMVFLLYSIIHFYWGMGGQAFRFYMVPVRENGDYYFTLKKQLEFALSVFALLLFIIFVFFDFIERELRYSYFIFLVLAIMFLVRAIGNFKTYGFFKKKLRTLFYIYDTYFYAPFAFILSLLLFILFFHYNDILS